MNQLPTFLGYIDPGSGTLLLQIILAGLLGAVACFRKAIFGFLGLFKAKSHALRTEKPAVPVTPDSSVKFERQP